MPPNVVDRRTRRTVQTVPAVSVVEDQVHDPSIRDVLLDPVQLLDGRPDATSRLWIERRDMQFPGPTRRVGLALRGVLRHLFGIGQANRVALQGQETGETKEARRHYMRLEASDWASD
jgi:hypothetical protein